MRSSQLLAQNLRKSAVADMSAAERFYNRSIKIRMSVADSLSRESRKNLENRRTWETLSSLARFCANEVETSGWDVKPASMVAAGRWVEQLCDISGYFAIVPLGSGFFTVQYRSEERRRAIEKRLRAFRPRKRAR